MKKLLTLATMYMCSLLSFAQFSGSGSGTENDPYLIFNPIQLNQMRNFLNTERIYFRLMADIDLSDYLEDENPENGWQPIGTSSVPFKGVLDGNGKRISGLIIKSSDNCVGLFGNVKNATINNLNLKGVIQGHNYVGGFCGYATNLSSNNCEFEGDIIGNSYIGGLAGKLSATSDSRHTYTIKDFNYLSGSVNTEGDYIGGVCGYVEHSGTGRLMFDSCCVQADIYGKDNVGGICGKSSYVQNFQYSSYIGKITANSFVGGCVGYLDDSKIDDSYVQSDIIASGDYVGGLCGSAQGYTHSYIINSYSEANISGCEKVGGLVGYQRNCSVSKSYSMGFVSGVENVGGIVGEAYDNASVKSSFAVNTYVKATGNNAGRIVGFTSGDYKYYVGAKGTSEENKSYNKTIVICNGSSKTDFDDLQDGTNISLNSLKYKATYVGVGWDFTDHWELLETESLPYMKRQSAPPIINSKLISGSTEVKGKCVEGSKVTLNVDGTQYQQIVTGNAFTFSVPPLKVGCEVRCFVQSDGKEKSYYVSDVVAHPGSGTEEDPYQIYTASDLSYVWNKGFYKLMNDIDLTDYIMNNSSSEGWVPIGRTGAENNIHFDGNNHTVSGLWCNTTYDNTGLFSYLVDGSIKNLIVETAKDKQVKGGSNTGILIGKMLNGTIENCIVRGCVADGTPVGGLVGLMDGGSISKCRSAVSINTTQGTTYVGGLVGEMTAGTIAECVTIGTLNATGTESYAGGLVGKNSAAVSNCYSTMTINSSYNAAGLIAYNYGSVEKCYATGNLKSNNYAAGIIGYNDGANAIIKNCIALNEYIEVIYESQQSQQGGGYGQRIVGGLKNNASAPEMNNYALNTTQLSVNNVPQRIYDDLMNGVAKTKTELTQQSTYTSLGWSFDEVWGMTDSADYPLLKWVIELNGQEEPDFIPGDANGDGKVNGTDIVVIANMLLGRKDKNGAADANQDGKVNGTDIVVVANIVLGRSSAPFRKAPVVTASGSATLSIEPFDITAGSEATMTIDLNNPDDVLTLVQFDLTLPEGLSIKTVGGDYDIDMAGRTSWRKHSLDANLNDGYYTFLLKSDSNTPIDGTSGGIITVTLVADASFDSGKIVIDNTVLTTPDEVEINPACYEYEITVPTALPTLKIDRTQPHFIYNLQGQRLSVLQKGINIIDGKKVMVK